MGGIFINYRRVDGNISASAVARAIRQHFGADVVFFDKSMEPGTRYPTQLERWLAECDVLVAIIHDSWLVSMRDKQSSHKDWVRHEIATTLASGKTVIPVLIGNATMPTHPELPDDVIRLADAQYIRVRSDSLDADLARLVHRLERYVAPVAAPAPAPNRRPVREMRFPALVRRTAACSAVALLAPLALVLVARPSWPPVVLFAVALLSVMAGCYVLLAWLVVRASQRLIISVERRVSRQSGVEYVLRTGVLAFLSVAVGYVGIRYAAATLPGPWHDYVALTVAGLAGWWAVGAGLRGYRIDRAARSDGVPGVVIGWRRDGRPDPFVWRRAAQGLHERLTGSPDWQRPRSRSRQEQVTKEYGALVDTRSALLRQASRPWRQWLVEEHAVAAVLSAVWAAGTIGLVLAVVAEEAQAHHSVLRAVCVAAGTTVLVCGAAVAGIRLGHGTMRRRDTHLAAELADSLAALTALAQDQPID